MEAELHPMCLSSWKEREGGVTVVLGALIALALAFSWGASSMLVKIRSTQVFGRRLLVNLDVGWVP